MGDIDGQLARHLHRVNMHQCASGMGQFGDLPDRKHRAGFVIGPHDRYHGDIGRQRGAQGIHVKAALFVDADLVDDIATTGQVITQGENGRMLDGGGDDFAFVGLGIEGRQNGGVVGFGGAGGKDDFAGQGRADKGAYLFAGLLQGAGYRFAEI